MSSTVEPVFSPPKKDYFKYEEWAIETALSHIMGSQCEAQTKCSSSAESKDFCNVCRFGKELKCSSLPDMVFADNCLIIENENGGSIEFNALDALKQVGKSCHHLEVAHAKAWQEARSDCEYSKRILKDYDWTYSTSYSGTIKGPMKITSTDERINLEKLKVQEEILFYKEVYLYEDELDDNGCTKCTVKVRVMASGFFIVFRHYLRVDHVMIRVNDTRLYFEKGRDGILRESSVREAPMQQLKIDAATYRNPDLVWQYLSLKEEHVEKIIPV